MILKLASPLLSWLTLTNAPAEDHRPRRPWPSSRRASATSLGIPRTSVISSGRTPVWGPLHRQSPISQTSHQSGCTTAQRVAGSESRDRPAADADLVGKHSAVGAASSRQRYAAVQAEQRLPVGRLVLDDDLDVAHRRTQICRQGAQCVVNRLFERIIETRLRTRIHLRNGARIGAGIE